MTDPLHVLVLGGSSHRPSRTASLMRVTAQALQERGASCRIWNLAERPPVPGSQGDARHPGALAPAVQVADAVVLASPLYHNSYCGILKGALDDLTAGDLRSKAVALLSSAGASASSQAIDHLRLVVRALGAIAIPTQVVSTERDHLLDDDGHYRLTSPSITARLSVMADELLWLADLLRSGPAMPAAYSRWAGAPEPACLVATDRRPRRADPSDAARPVPASLTHND